MQRSKTTNKLTGNSMEMFPWEIFIDQSLVLPVLVSCVVDHAGDQLLLVFCARVVGVHRRPGLERREFLREDVSKEHEPELHAAEEVVG